MRNTKRNNDKKKNQFVTSIFLAIATMIISDARSQIAISTVDISTPIMTNAPLLLGISFDARTSLTATSGAGQVGYYNTDGTIIPEVDLVFNNFPMTTLRYPANGIMQGFEWKKSIGIPASGRPTQILFGGTPTPQVVEFGFDEFMAMTASKGVDPKDVQIMVPIYDTANVTLTATQMKGAIPYPANSNADWVEYANSPNDGTNPGDGTDWALVRANNGHAAPYGIELWNMGNEPYTPGEFTVSGVNSYISTILPIIDSMLAIDPTIKITVTVQSNVSSMWTTTILNSPLLQGKIYGINTHFFLSEEVVGGIIPSGVDVAHIRLINLASAAQTQGYKLIVGDNAHEITAVGSSPTQAEQDIAMQWQGANLNADFLLAMSQVNNIERSNFWVYGYTAAQWHPIRDNNDGTYTSMPSAELYKILNPVFLDNSVSVVTTSPIASDGNIYTVRSSAFLKNDLSQLNFVAVNRDKLNSIPIQINGISGYDILNARLLYSTALNSDSIYETNPTIDLAGNYILPPMSILIVEYGVQTTVTIDNLIKESPTTVYPNPANNTIYFTNPLTNFYILNSLGEIISPQIESANSLSVENFANGIYFIKTENELLKFIINK